MITNSINNFFFGADDANESEFIPLIPEDEDSFKFKKGEDENLIILPLRNMVLFPGVVAPLSLARKKSLSAARQVYKKGGVVGLFAQKEVSENDPRYADLYQIGTVAKILKILELPDGSTSAIVQGLKRIFLEKVTNESPYLQGSVKVLDDIKPKQKEKREFNALIEAIKDTTIKIIKSSFTMPVEATFALRNIEDPGLLINYIAANLNFTPTDKQALLEINEVSNRGFSLLGLLNKELQMVDLKLSIQSKTIEGIEQQQKEYYLQQQIKAIQDELGDNVHSRDIQGLKEKAAKKKWSDQVKETFEKEITKLERLSQYSPDYATQVNYLETIVNLPWGSYSKDNFNLKNAQKVLEKDHFGMEKVKERIIEHLAVLKLKNTMKSPIICLYGPPGVGKTSLGKSVAEALKRKYVRISLGGLHDEAEIRGHRRTYIGAMPGRIVQSLLKAGTSNPVFILDEIDKVNHDFRGDPASALLEVLDPEQNHSFHDNFLDIDYDLSRVMFIATANNLGTIAQPLLDRMEIIEINGYILEEKTEIAVRHLIPKEIENHGIQPSQIEIPKETIAKIIEGYTRESGVRELDKQLAKIMRKVAYKLALNEKFDAEIKPENLIEYLGVERYSRDRSEENEYTGLATGLAWTAVGGEILFVETSLSKAKTPKLTLTGNLGDVMKESAALALEYLKAHAAQWNIPETVFEEYNVHIHVPEGAIPKDGPSAGITMVTSLTSAFTKRKVKKSLAMTGEITLRGKVLPVGGIKEKILAAKRVGITEIILCTENKKDIDEIKETYIKGLNFSYVKDIKEVLELALLPEKVKE